MVTDSGLIAAIAQWVSTIGVPAMFIAWYRQVICNHRQDLDIAALKNRFADYVTMRTDLNNTVTLVTEIRIIVGQLKDESDRTRRIAERRSTDTR